MVYNMLDILSSKIWVIYIHFTIRNVKSQEQSVSTFEFCLKERRKEKRVEVQLLQYILFKFEYIDVGA